MDFHFIKRHARFFDCMLIIMVTTKRRNKIFVTKNIFIGVLKVLLCVITVILLLFFPSYILTNKQDCFCIILTSR